MVPSLIGSLPFESSLGQGDDNPGSRWRQSRFNKISVGSEQTAGANPITSSRSVR